MDGREIPGFYYDKEKKKYFKIQPNHAAASAKPYTKSNVEKVKLAEKTRQSELVHRTEVAQQLVRRSEILYSATAAGIGINREVAQELRPFKNLDNSARAYASTLREDWRIHMEGTPISAFVTDPTTSCCLISRSHYAGGAHWQVFSSTNLLNFTTHAENSTGIFNHKFRAARWNRPQFEDLAVFRSDVSSISLSPSRVAMLTTMGGPSSPSITLFPLERCSPPISQFQVTFRPQGEVDVWASAANPFIHDTSTFAAALTDEVDIYTDAEGQWDSNTLLKTSTDAFAVEWLSPSVLATGLRSGVVHLSDTRSGGSSLRLRHPGSITGIRRVSDHNLVVCGLQDALAMYDLRMPIIEEIHSIPSTGSKRRKRNTPPPVPSSRSVVCYDFHSPFTRMGFDISTDAGVVAAVDSSNLVQLYSLHTGRHVKAITLDGSVKQLRFTRDGPSNAFSREQLVACCGTELVGLQW